jgi:radical SAM superfamily enzyme YgiQ (UPF0313 family)
MPHVALLSFSGLRVREEKLAELGARLPGLAARAAATAQLPSLGLLTLAGMLPDDWTCSYQEVTSIDDDLVQLLVRQRPQLVAMSALTASAQLAYSLADRLRAENLATVFGGLHATTCADEAVAHFDAVCTGEGELVWPKILRDVSHGKLRPRYAAVRTSQNIDWPIPRFGLLAGRPIARWTLQTQRGCPLACEFCAASRLISRFREKPMERIREELAAIQRVDPRPTVELADDNTFVGPRDAKPLLAALADANIRYFTEVDWRIGEQPALLRQLAASGCVQVLVGVESLIFRYPGMGSITAPLERVMAAVDEIQDAGVAVIGCFIVGADGETRASLKRLTTYLQQSRLADVQVTLHTPFPGTALRSRLSRQGRLLENRDWSHLHVVRRDISARPDVGQRIRTGLSRVADCRFRPETVGTSGGHSARHLATKPGFARHPMATTDAIAAPIDDVTAATDEKTPLKASTLPLYLVGSRRAIIQIAESRAALWVGLLFVLSAGFAREYDGADLLHEPWHLALPLVASLGTSLVLYALVFSAARNRGLKELSFFEGYRTLLTLYWWTAPLAWLYAIPVERFLSAGDATATNLWLLAAVSVWRVLLITRAVSVWLGASLIGVFFIVMFFADSVAVLIAFISPRPIFNIMGGVRLSEPDRVVLDAMLTVMIVGGLSWFVWLIAACVVIGKRTPTWQLAASLVAERRVSKPLWAVAALLLVIGIGILPIGQPQQRHRWQVEQSLHRGDLAAAVQYAAAHSREDFPPVWDPPPRLGYGEERPRTIDVIAAVERHRSAPWFRGLYVEKLTQDPFNTFWDAAPTGDDADPTDFNQVLAAFEKYVPVASLDDDDRFALERISEDDRIDVNSRTALRNYLNRTGN